VIYVFDASAMIALLRDEPGAPVVRSLLASPDSDCFAHALNLCEVFYDLHRERGEAAAQGALTTLAGLGIFPREDMDAAFWQSAGRVKSVHRRVSLADCCAIALARRVAGELVTTDHSEMDPIAAAGVLSIHFIR
jgi:predicted nucleic acid-binding protein